MAGGVRREITNPWLVEEPEETKGLDFHDIRQQQQRIIEGKSFLPCFILSTFVLVL